MRIDYCELRMQQDFYGAERHFVELKMSRNSSDEIELTLTPMCTHEGEPNVEPMFSINKGEARMIISYIQNHFEL